MWLNKTPFLQLLKKYCQIKLPLYLQLNWFVSQSNDELNPKHIRLVIEQRTSENNKNFLAENNNYSTMRKWPSFFICSSFLSSQPRAPFFVLPFELFPITISTAKEVVYTHYTDVSCFLVFILSLPLFFFFIHSVVYQDGFYGAEIYVSAFSLPF